MVHDVVPDTKVLLAQALADGTGQDPDSFSNVVLVYQTMNDEVGALTFTCCNEHSLKLFALGIQVILDDPDTAMGQPCKG